MFKVTFKFESGEDVTTFAQEGENLLEVARLTNVAIDAPCGGNASCGKCKVKLVEGELHSPKTRHISDEEYQGGWRLACVSKITGDVAVEVPDIASAYRSRMKVADLSSKEEIAIFESAKNDIESAGLQMKNSMDILDITMDIPSLDDTMPDNERFVRAVKKTTGASQVKLPFQALRISSKASQAFENPPLPCPIPSEADPYRATIPNAPQIQHHTVVKWRLRKI